ncbi:MAG: DUF1573 domain-containing protein [Bacteroidota bacterium]
MNRYLIIIFLIILSSGICSCNSSGNDKAENTAETSEEKTPEIAFDKNVHDFGKIISGERVAYGFKFSNTGNAPLLITGVRSGCGCTVGDYPKEPLLPGESGRIDVVFNSSGRTGAQSENVRVLTNATDKPVNLRITAEAIRQ